MKGYFPCGICQAYVAVATGCKHYRPVKRYDESRRAYYREYHRKRREAERQVMTHA